MGTLAWLEAYHGNKPQNGTYCPFIIGLEFELLSSHAGSIISVINLEFEGNGLYSTVGLHAVGVNGRLPNADLVTTAVRSFQYAGVPVVLQDGTLPLEHVPWIDNYPIYLSNLLSFMKEQALGFPKLNHGLFALYNIEAVSLSGNIGSSFDVNLSQIGL